jgi:hypothetical protein
MPADAALGDQRKSLGVPEHLEVLSKAIGDLAASRPPFAHEVMVRLADLRRRQGRIREAESHPMAAVGMAELSLDRDDPGGAIPVAEQVLRHLPLANKTQRAAAVELAVRAKSPGLGH